MSTFWKKLLISILGLVIISIFVCRVFEETVQEGFPDVVVNIANAARSAAADTTELIMGITRSITAKIQAIAASADRKVISARDNLIASLRYAKRTAMNVGRDIRNRAIDASARAWQSAQRNFLFTASTGQRIGLFTKQGLLNIYNWMKLLSIIGMLIILGGYLWNVMMWFVNSTICFFRFMSLFNSCALWYFLDIISWFIYYILYFIPWGIMDLFFMSWISEVNDDIEKWFFYYNVWEPLMQVLDDFDCLFYEIFGFYIIHFKRNVKDKCFVCEMPKFPPFPNLFDKNGIKKAYNEYGLGSIPFLKA
jgi:hypothetical protein